LKTKVFGIPIPTRVYFQWQIPDQTLTGLNSLFVSELHLILMRNIQSMVESSMDMMLLTRLRMNLLQVVAMTHLLSKLLLQIAVNLLEQIN
jgi:hypothetical protein